MAQPIQTPFIAKWFNNKEAALSLRFDDSLKSHVITVIPLLNKYGIKASFMVSPGRANFKENEYFWKNEVPAMGHDLGNHTMHHHGAKNISDADYEIGEATKIINKLYPARSNLLLFASGGGKLWGGKKWIRADSKYKKLIKKYNLIDLYDGRHQSFSVDGTTSTQDLLIRVQKTLSSKGHLALTFHTVGAPNFRDILRKYIKGMDLAISESEFNNFVKLIDEHSDRLWIASLLDILKYQWEYSHSTLVVTSTGENSIEMQYTADFNTALYDHPLTLAVPTSISEFKIYQDKTLIQNTPYIKGDYNLFNILPKSSIIRIERNF